MEVTVQWLLPQGEAGEHLQFLPSSESLMAVVQMLPFMIQCSCRLELPGLLHFSLSMLRCHLACVELVHMATISVSSYGAFGTHSVFGATYYHWF